MDRRIKEEIIVKKNKYMVSRPWYDNGADERSAARRERGGLADLAAGQEGRALLESYSRLYRKHW